MHRRAAVRHLRRHRRRGRTAGAARSAFDEAANAPFALPDDERAPRRPQRSDSHERFHVSDFWSLYVAVLTLASASSAAPCCCRDVAARGTASPGKAAPDTTGHVWDERPRPSTTTRCRSWWMWLFWITIVFAVVYLVLYPGLGSFPACSAGRPPARMRRSAAASTSASSRCSRSTRDGHRRRSRRIRRRARSGERLFLNYCAQCHGSDARGGTRLPEPARRRLAVRRRAGDHRGDDHRRPARASCRRSARRSAREASRTSSHYVRSLSGLPHDSSAAQLGKPLFADLRRLPRRRRQGQPALGAPNLTDKIWLYGSSEAAIAEDASRKGRNATRRTASRDAGAQGHPGDRQDPPAGRVRVGTVESRPSGRGRQCSARMPPIRTASCPTPSRKAVREPISQARRRGHGDEVELYEIRKKIYPRAVHGVVRALALALGIAHAARVLRPAVAHVERPPGGAVRPRRAQVLHLRAGVLAAGRHLPDASC